MMSAGEEKVNLVSPRLCRETGAEKLTFEDLDPVFISKPLSFLIDWHIKAQNDRQLLRFLKHRSSPHNILSMDRANVDSRDLHTKSFSQSTRSRSRKGRNKRTGILLVRKNSNNASKDPKVEA